MTAAQQKARIGDLLIEAELISEDQLIEALRLQREEGGKTVENLIALGFLEQREFLNFLSKQPGVASINLLNYTIPQAVIDLVPEEFALKHEVLPIDKLGRDLTVGMACPLDSKSIKTLEDHTGLRIRPLLVSMGDIRVALDRYYVGKGNEPEDQGDTLSLADIGMAGTTGGNTTPEPPAAPPAEPKSEPEPVQASEPETEEAAPAVEKQDAVELADSTLTFEGVVHLVRKIHTLPALPETVTQVKEVIERENSSANDVAAIVERDPNIAVKVVSIANSAAYGLPNRVDTVEMATRLLGLAEVYSIVLSSAVINYFDNDNKFDYKLFWRRSLRCAITSRIIAQKCKMDSCGGVFTAGLLHDIGKAVFAEIAPERYEEVNQDADDAAIIIQENKLFHVAHPEVGYMLIENWGLPDEIIQPIRFHHDFTEASSNEKLVAVVSLGALMSSMYGRVNKDNVQEFSQNCQAMLKALGLSDKEFVAILGESSKAIKVDMEA